MDELFSTRGRSLIVCRAHGDVVIPEGVEILPADLLWQGGDVTGLTLPRSLRVIGSSVFRDLQHLTRLTIPAGVEVIDQAGMLCPSLRSLTFEGVPFLAGQSAFFRLGQCLREVTFLSDDRPAMRRFLPIFYKGICRTLSRRISDAFTLQAIYVNDLTVVPFEMMPLALAGEFRRGLSPDSPRYRTFIRYIRRYALPLTSILETDREFLTFILRNRLLPAHVARRLLDRFQQKDDLLGKAALLDYLGSTLPPARRAREQTRQAVLDRTAEHRDLCSLSGGIAGLSFAVNGSLPVTRITRSRKVLRDFLAAHGARLESTVHLHTDYLLVSSPLTPTHSLLRAIHQNVPRLFMHDLMEMAGLTVNDCWVDDGHLLYVNDPISSTLAVPDGITVLDDHCLADHMALQELILPDSLTAIGECALSGCFSLQRVCVPSGLRTIGPRAFAGCTSLRKLTLPRGVTIAPDAFRGCKGLTLTFTD